MVDTVHLRIGSLELLALVALYTVATGFVRRPGGMSEASSYTPHAIEVQVETPGESPRLVRAMLPLTIGRARDAALVLADPQVSRWHARIDAGDGEGEIYLKDLNSRNGTAINGRPIEGTVEVFDGDEIRIGLARIVVSGVDTWK